jgi:hypothetical protein
MNLEVMQQSYIGSVRKISVITCQGVVIRGAMDSRKYHFRRPFRALLVLEK